MNYKIKKLIAGGVIDPEYIGKTLVAVPDGKDEVVFENKIMELTQKPLTCRVFDDKFKIGKKYKMCYWEWKPLEGVALEKYLYFKSIS